ncbi:hypothetical protein Tco_1158928 [Tanacetum coccineum]
MDLRRREEKSLIYNTSFLGEYECSSLALDRRRKKVEDEIGSLETRLNYRYNKDAPVTSIRNLDLQLFKVQLTGLQQIENFVLVLFCKPDLKDEAITHFVRCIGSWNRWNCAYYWTMTELQTLCDTGFCFVIIQGHNSQNMSKEVPESSSARGQGCLELAVEIAYQIFLLLDVVNVYIRMFMRSGRCIQSDGVEIQHSRVKETAADGFGLIMSL